jgi:hypothetical protein
MLVLLQVVDIQVIIIIIIITTIIGVRGGAVG